jgi:hypothetical protein
VGKRLIFFPCTPKIRKYNKGIFKILPWQIKFTPYLLKTTLSAKEPRSGTPLSMAS